MSDLEIGLSAIIALAVAALAFVLGKRTNAPKVATVTPKPLGAQAEVEQKVQILVDKAKAAKEQAQKLAGEQRDEALSEHQKQLQEGVNILSEDSNALNEYLKKVGSDVRRS